ncbi:glucosamine-6-phosphate deaminase [Lederbergia graminis]|uniref:Glucosamine-6-phosphate deaminase n=1 Tax=Lederbergia graminis TaxID=735518 RepID=A0ABW0LKI4_9BACI
MELIITENYEEMSAAAAEIVVSLLKQKPAATLALTTGNTPLRLYEKLIELQQSEQISLRETTIFSTEEYLGISEDAYFSLYNWLKRSLLQPCDIKPDQIIRLKGDALHPDKECEYFSQQIEQYGGLDIIIEGLGTNGHIGFNEPGTKQNSRTRVVTLSEETKEYNFQYWNHEVPDRAMTIGMSEILAAKKIVLLASGTKKAEALYKALKGPVTSEFPASFLRLAEQLTVIADKDAAQLFMQEESVWQST